jgi:hypothetical protein
MVICLACSVGGHLTQMRQLSKLYKKYEYFYLTEDTEITRDFAKNEKVYFLRLTNRRKISFPLTFIHNAFKTIIYLLREIPLL